ncbi:hypothetical protein HanRHA438_Chr15g0729921 [Helianthus annuus]|uniref:Uncharacterized protein n=1 Tax=Helianthus annuus TaxID=4232 RepID=A0A251SC99_HELAN|nr:hypothetical protein HanXRQr2_Chr15g0717731 [Helianthus annuus]KAJ0694949.1 hypothetical protein HanPI659440_Chr15g0614601 [Helianthus annuus]KAJ0833290.1 hypothetical protein HanPSC8_Chr15g0688601 [Helianthus annuus]KAJ0846885.1 hypothetical protein HanRHA438_Chr15g0729921 [Helianthus annuus]
MMYVSIIYNSIIFPPFLQTLFSSSTFPLPEQISILLFSEFITIILILRIMHGPGEHHTLSYVADLNPTKDMWNMKA